MKNKIESGKIGPYKWVIYQEEYPENPLDLQDSFGTLISETRNTEFFNDNGKYYRGNMAAAVREARNVKASVCIVANADGSAPMRVPWRELDELDLPETLYFATKEEIKKEGWKRRERKTPAQWAERCMLAALKEVRAWIEGDVYGFVVTRKGKEIDSCWGYYGDLGYVIGEAKAAAEHLNEKHQSVGPKFRGKVRTVDVNALRWWDKVNGNTYFASAVTINYGLPNETRLYMPFQYGYGDQYEYEAAAVLRLAGIICKDGFENSLWRMRETLGFILRTNIRDAKKSELTAISKMLANLGRDF